MIVVQYDFTLNFSARYYGSALGRFTSPDPENASAFLYPDDPQSWNAYAYGRNNPLAYTDPTGESYQICDANGKNCAKDQLTDDEFASEKKAAQANGEVFNRDGTMSHTDANGNKVVDGTYRQTDVDLPGDAATNRAAAGFIVANFNNAMTEFGKNAAYAATGTLALRGLGFAAEGAAELGVFKNTKVVLNWAHNITSVRSGHIPPPGSAADITSAIEGAVQTGNYTLKGGGLIEGTTTINGTTVGFRGRFVDGVARIATVFTKR